MTISTVQRRDPSAPGRKARGAPSTRGRRRVRRLGPERGAVAVMGDFNYLGSRGRSSRAAGQSRASGKGTVADAASGARLQVRHHHPRRAPCSRRPIRSPAARRSRRAPGRWCGIWPTSGVTPTGCSPGAIAYVSTRRSRSTKCTWAVGAVTRPTPSAFSSYTEVAEPLIRHVLRHRVHPRGVPPAHGAPLLRLVGLPDHRLLRPDPALRRRRRSSCS